MAVLILSKKKHYLSRNTQTQSSLSKPGLMRPDPVKALKFLMEQGGLTAKDLEPMIGKRNRAYKILNRKRSLTLPMIWRLHTGLGIPAESLIRPQTPA